MLANDGLIRCLDCEFIASETECQVLDKRGDYLKCPKCGAMDDRLVDIDKPMTITELLNEVESLKSQKAALLAACKAALDSFYSMYPSAKESDWLPNTEIDRIAIESLRSAIKAGEGDKPRIKVGQGMESLENEIDEMQKTEADSAILDDAKREMFGDDADLLDDDMGAK